MRHSRPRSIIMATAVVLLLSACGTMPTNGGGGSGLTQDDVTTELNGSITAISQATAELQSDPALQAFQSSEFNAFFGTGGTISLATLASDPASMVDFIMPAADQNLERGVWTFDEGSGTWVNTAASDDLILAWTYMAFDAGTGTSANYDAELTFDWNNSTSTSGFGATVDVFTDTSMGTTVEVPTAMRVLLEVGPAAGTKTIGADLVMDFGWYDGCAATGTQPINDPTSFSLNGDIGFNDVLSFNDISFVIDDVAGGITSSGAVGATTEDASASFEWNLDLNGAIERTNCYFSDIALTDGTVSFTTSTTSGGDTDTFTFNIAFDNLVADATTGAFTSVDIDGDVEINGASAVTFDGSLDDEDGDGVWGDNVTLTFADGTSANLEAYIEGSVTVTSR